MAAKKVRPTVVIGQVWKDRDSRATTSRHVRVREFKSRDVVMTERVTKGGSGWVVDTGPGCLQRIKLTTLTARWTLTAYWTLTARWTLVER